VCVCVCVCATLLFTVLKVTHERMNGFATENLDPFKKSEFIS